MSAKPALRINSILCLQTQFYTFWEYMVAICYFLNLFYVKIIGFF